jgi:succinyl-CoA synthetase beta subunit
LQGIIHALEEHKEQLKAANMRIFVRRAGPNYQLGLKMMREVGEKLGVPVEVYGPEIPMTTIIPKAIAYLNQ